MAREQENHVGSVFRTLINPWVHILTCSPGRIKQAEQENGILAENGARREK
jgi:hypothetical protein